MEDAEVPKYRFKWANLPDDLLRGLCEDLELDTASPGDALREALGARPTEELVRDLWPSLRDRWLTKDGESRRAVVDDLWEGGLGSASRPSGKAAEMAFLRERKNARGLRHAVWLTLVARGELDAESTQPTIEGTEAQSANQLEHLTLPDGPSEKPVLAEPAKRGKAKPKPTKTLEQRLWDAADALRGNQEPSEYKHVMLGLVFLKYISDRFTERMQAIESELAAEGIPEARRAEFIEDRDEYAGHNVFWVPADARWDTIQARAKLPSIGQDIDTAMDLIEKENPVIRGVLPRNYGREGLDKGRLGQLVDLIGSIGFTETDDHGSDDVLGRVYEYFLGQFAGKETGKDAGAFYTPRSVVRTLVEMLEPFHGRVYDPCCGSGGMFVESAKFVTAHDGKRTDVAVYGQEFTDTTWKLAKMNLALRGIEADLGERSADSFGTDLHPDLRADFVLANPPFNVSNWWDAKLADDPRWTFGVPPQGNANFAWVQHFIYHLSPRGTAGFVLANGSLSSKSSGEGEIRRKLVEVDLVDCIVAMPDRLFLNTGIPVALWFVSKDRHGNGHRERAAEVLFIDARKLGRMESRRLRVLDDADIAKIADTYHSWRNHDGDYEDVPGFCKAAPRDEVASHDFVLTPGRYVGAEAAEVDDEPIEDKIDRLKKELFTEFEHGHQLEDAVRARLGGLLA